MVCELDRRVYDPDGDAVFGSNSRFGISTERFSI